MFCHVNRLSVSEHNRRLFQDAILEGGQHSFSRPFDDLNLIEQARLLVSIPHIKSNTG
jgi:hypothetical protein